MSAWSEQLTTFPSHAPGVATALGDEPILIDGLRVLFDQKVALVPVSLERGDDEEEGEDDADR